MSEDIELMSLELIDTIAPKQNELKAGSRSKDIFLHPHRLNDLCVTARAAHKLKKRVEELEAQIKDAYYDQCEREELEDSFGL